MGLADGEREEFIHGTESPISIRREIHRRQSHDNENGLMMPNGDLGMPQSQSTLLKSGELNGLGGGGRKRRKYAKREEDIKYEELNKLIDSAYACFDQGKKQEKEESAE